ncbi:hypothetical protein CBOM_00927 [Ceraceosorus bombacis]|uniref:Luciferase domain-containing protein n=1 Tax=Ceraceosorus bombacis TaxID=401625 RepID=A0A0P1BB81_9BASI|nr:hypothetical protein CBOM_00927 [Ceraceosorus bombacis]
MSGPTGALKHVQSSMESVAGLAKGLYARAPASTATLLSLLLSYLITTARSDYVLYRSLGVGGLAPPGPIGWLVHTFILRPLAMSSGREKDPERLPVSDEQVQGQSLSLDLPKRKGNAPFTFGLMPHRQLDQTLPEDGAMQKALASHFNKLATLNINLRPSISVLEAHNSPSLQVQHSPKDISPAQIRSYARLFLSGLHAPRSDGSSPLKEFAHIHLHDGSLHLVLSPSHARIVLAQGWGELHRLAGAFYRGHWWPLLILPKWLANDAKARWGYLAQRAQSSRKAALLPPTYLMIYAPRDEEELQHVKRIIDAAAAFALGHEPISEP